MAEKKSPAEIAAAKAADAPHESDLAPVGLPDKRPEPHTGPLTGRLLKAEQECAWLIEHQPKPLDVAALTAARDGCRAALESESTKDDAAALANAEAVLKAANSG